MGALEHTAAGAGAQRHAHSLWRALGLAPAASSVVSPLLLSSGDAHFPHPQPSHSVLGRASEGGSYLA